MKPWTRNDTKDWIASAQSRIEDFNYYLGRTVDFCEQQGIWENQKVVMCCLITCIWVSSMREENISFQEIIEIMGIENEYDEEVEDRIYSVCSEFQSLDHEEILSLLIKGSKW